MCVCVCVCVCVGGGGGGGGGLGGGVHMLFFEAMCFHAFYPQHLLIATCCFVFVVRLQDRLYS